MLLVVSAVGAGVAPSDDAAAVQDRQLNVPLDQWSGTYYLSTSCVESGAARIDLETAMKLTVLLTSRQRVLSLNRPVQITPTLWRINLDDLLWDRSLWKQVVALNGYHEFPDHITLRADWFVITMTDTRDSNAYYLMAYGERPATRDRAWQIMDVVVDPARRYGLIEGQSGVSKGGTRRIEELPAIRGSAWRTRDFLKFDLEHDPLEQPEGDQLHDAEEHIILCEVHDPETSYSGVKPFYLLTNGKGQTVDKADVRLVEDTTEFRGFREITAPGSCIQCHAAGGNYPTKDDFRDLWEKGVNTWTYDRETARALQSFYFNDLTKKIDRWNEDYGGVVQRFCGVGPIIASTRFAMAVKRYDEPLDLDRMAWESNVHPNELRLALAWAQESGIRLPARAAGLTVGRDMPRDAAESGGSLAIKGIIERWSQK